TELHAAGPGGSRRARGRPADADDAVSDARRNDADAIGGLPAAIHGLLSATGLLSGLSADASLRHASRPDAGILAWPAVIHSPAHSFWPAARAPRANAFASLSTAVVKKFPLARFAAAKIFLAFSAGQGRLPSNRACRGFAYYPSQPC